MLGRKCKYRIGSRIVANFDIEIFPWDGEDCVAAGDHGEVVDVDPDTGDLTILMDRLIPALVGRKNYLLVRADHLCQIRLECTQFSLLQIATKSAGMAFAATVAFMAVMAAGDMIKETRHKPYAVRYPAASAASAASAETKCVVESKPKPY